MSGVIYTRLISRLKQRGDDSREGIDSPYISKVIDEIRFVIGTALKKNDLPGLAVILSSLNDDVFDFFSKSYQVVEHKNKVVAALFVELTRKTFVFTNTKKDFLEITISPEKFQVILDCLPELKDRSLIYKCARESSLLSPCYMNDYYVNPAHINEHEQALILLLSGNMPDDSSDHFKHSDLFDSVRNNVAINVFSRILNRTSGPVPALLDDDTYKALRNPLPDHLLAFEHLAYNYIESLNKKNPQVSMSDLAKVCLQHPNPCVHQFPDHDLHIKKLTASKSLLATIDIYLEHMSNLNRKLDTNADGGIIYGPNRFLYGADNFLAAINEDAILTRAAVRHIDTLCNFLSKNIADPKVQNMLPELTRQLRKFFSRTSLPYLPESGSHLLTNRDLVAKSCIDLPMIGIVSLLCSYLERLRTDLVNKGQRLTVDTPAFGLAEWIGSALPYSALISIVEHDLLHESLLHPVLFTKSKSLSEYSFIANPEFMITQIATLFGCAERNYPQCVTSELENTDSAASNLLKLIHGVEKKAGCENLYERVFMREYHRAIDQSLKSVASGDADMSFLLTTQM